MCIISSGSQAVAFDRKAENHLCMWAVLSTHLACHTRWREPLVFAVFVEEPAHHATASADLWTWNVDVWPHH